MLGSTTTLSPGFRWVTAAPASTTVATYSCPRMLGGRVPGRDRQDMNIGSANAHAIHFEEHVGIVRDGRDRRAFDSHLPSSPSTNACMLLRRIIPLADAWPSTAVLSRTWLLRSLLPPKSRHHGRAQSASTTPGLGPIH